MSPIPPRTTLFPYTTLFRSMITWTLTYEGLESPVQQAHIHLGERHTNGGVSAFLCTNLDNGPPDTPPCPNVAASVDGTIMAAQDRKSTRLNSSHSQISYAVF